MLKKLKILFFSALAIFNFIAGNLCAQENDSVRLLEKTQIIATKQPKSHNFNIQVMDNNFLQKTASFQISDALKYFAGVNVKDFGGVGGLKTVSVRGLGSVNTAVLIDEMKMNNSLNGQIDLSKVSFNNVYEVVLANEGNNFNSPASNNTSPNSIILKKNLNFGDSKIKLNAAFNYASFNTYNPSINFAVLLNKNNYFSINGNYLYSEGNYNYKIKNGNTFVRGIRENSASKFANGEIEFASYQTKKWTYKVNLKYFFNDRQLPGYIVLYAKNGSQSLVEQDINANAKMKYAFSDSCALSFFGKYERNMMRYIDTNIINSEHFLQNDYLQNEYFFSAVFDKKIKNFTIGLASDVNFNDLVALTTSRFFAQRLSSLNELRFAYFYKDFNISATLLHQSIFDFLASGNTSKHHFSPALHADYSLKNWKFRLFIKENFRNPSFMELFYNNNLNNTTNLRPETTFQTDLGVNFAENNIGILDYFNISADFYYNDIKDKIIAVPTYNLFSWTMQNIGKVKILGCDVNLNVAIQPTKDFSIYANATYTFQNAKDYSNPDFSSYKKQLAYTPKHSASAVFGLNYYVDISYSLLFSGKRYSNGSQSVLTEVPAFFEHNITVSKIFPLKKIKLRTFVKLNNIANSNYEIVKFYPMPGFNFLLGIAVEL